MTIHVIFKLILLKKIAKFYMFIIYMNINFYKYIYLVPADNVGFKDWLRV